MKLIGPVRRNGRYGYITTSGDFAIEPIYEELGELSEGLISFRSGGKLGFLNTDGSVKISARFEHDDSLFYSFKDGLIGVSSQGKKGYIDTQGNWVIEPAWHRADNFLNDMALVSSMAGYFVIDKRGTILSKLNIWSVRQWQDWVKDWNCFRCMFTNDTPDFADGCLNWHGEIVFPPTHSELTEFYQGIAGFRDGEQALDEQWGLVDFSGAIKKAPQFFSLQEFSEGLAAAARDMTEMGETTGYGYIDIKGNWQIEPKFGVAGSFSDGLASVSMEPFLMETSFKKFGYINRTGELITPLIYTRRPDVFSRGKFFDGYAIVTTENEQQVIDHGGNIIYQGPL